MLIRRERDTDQDTVRQVHTAAFTGHLGRPADQEPVEGWLVDELRKGPDWIGQLSLVAEVDGTVAGHVVCSRARLEPAGTPLLGLGPLGVLPDAQGRGVGSALMHAVLAAADALDEPAVCLVGEPDLYRRFGFVPAAEHGVAAPDPRWGRYFQIRPLTTWTGVGGTFWFAPPFEGL